MFAILAVILAGISYTFLAMFNWQFAIGIFFMHWAYNVSKK